jgi:hypothetical protein
MKKESFYFGLMMCTGMVIVMTFYNLFIHGLIGTMPLKGILFQWILTLMIAFIIELFIGGPVAHKIAFSLPYDKEKSLSVILCLSFLWWVEWFSACLFMDWELPTFLTV